MIDDSGAKQILDNEVEAISHRQAVYLSLSSCSLQLIDEHQRCRYVLCIPSSSLLIWRLIQTYIAVLFFFQCCTFASRFRATFTTSWSSLQSRVFPRLVDPKRVSMKQISGSESYRVNCYLQTSSRRDVGSVYGPSDRHDIATSSFRY